MSNGPQLSPPLAGCLVLKPPYALASATSTSRVPLGAMVVADGADPSAVAQALLAREHVPWCPICLLAADTNVGADQPRWLAVAQPPFTPARIAAAVRTRPAPTPRDLASYIAGRIAQPGEAPVLRRALGEDEPWSGHRTSLWRRLKRLGRFTERDWQAVQQMTLALRYGRLAHRSSARGIALGIQVDARTLRRWTREYLGIPLAQAVAWSGWEPALEAALRAGGYVQSTSLRAAR